MKIKIPGRTTHVCNRCKREGHLQTCHVCEQEFCLTCHGTVTSSWGFTTLCHMCADRDDVRKICERYAEKLTPLFKARDAALKRLGRKQAAKTEEGE